jgi:hypothetical protein
VHERQNEDLGAAPLHVLRDRTLSRMSGPALGADCLSQSFASMVESNSSGFPLSPERIMTVSSNEQVVFKDYPLTFWLMGLLLLFVGVALFGWDARLRVLTSLEGALLIVFPSILTVTVDRTRGMLNLRYRSLIGGSTKAYPLNEISLVNVAQDIEGERLYRLELILRSGEVVPLRGGYTIGKRRYERRAQRLRSAIGVGGGVLGPGRNIRITISKC